MKKLFPNIIFPLVLVTISIVLCFRNYTPGTYLTGWDSLHPEFNFSLAFERIFSGVWRADQGVGTIAAHSHMADLPRVVLLWLTSFILPVRFLRYFYIFLCLVLGPLGMYFFLKYVFQKETDNFWIYPAVMLGALFYLLNLGTVQIFYVPFEMFVTTFAFLPWLFLGALRYLREGKKKNLLVFALLTILSSPMAYAATLWYATFAGLFIFLISFVLLSPAKTIRIKRAFLLGAVVLFLNLYWILPNMYSVVNQSSVISNSKINVLFSPEAFLRNQGYGDFKDVLIQKNFLFGWRNFDFGKGQFADLLGVWENHLSNPLVLQLGYVLAAFSVLGLIFVLLKKERVGLALIPVLIFALFFLLNANPPLGKLYLFLYGNSDLFREGMRMPFTKFSILFEFLGAFYFGYFAYLLFTLRKKYFLAFKLIVLVGILAGLVYFTLPAFDGNLIGQNVRGSLPAEYFDAYSWLNSKDGRVAKLPIYTLNNWEFHNWGFEGSAWFSWFLSKNPQFDRDFDRWSKFNENFFQEAGFALYNNDPASFENTLKKYQVRYLLLDESVINPGGTNDILFIPETKELLSRSAHIREVQKFGFLTIYETNFDFGEKFISAPKDVFGEYVGESEAAPTGTPVLSGDLSVNRGFESAHNCDLERVGVVTKEFVKAGIRYTADQGGVSCDYLNYPDLKYKQAYILRLAGENKAGRSVKIYLYNYKTKRMDLEELLPTGIFDKYFLIPAKNLDGGGYTLNFETRSFGRVKSENVLSKVEFYLPEPSLQDIPTQISSPLSNNLKVQNARIYGTWAYRVDVQGSGLMQLGQGFEKGWVAFIARDLPFTIYHLPFLEHQKINGWANGWLVPNSSLLPFTIYLVYWPQLLEWGGMTLGLIALALIL